MSAKNDLLTVLQNIVHEETQFPEQNNLAYITVKRIGRLETSGALDFGGSEYASAEIRWLEPEKGASDDKYGWWNLDSGKYFVQFNESLKLDDKSGILLQIWSKALHAGVSHPTMVITESQDPLHTLITVGDQGTSIKENARLSEVRMI